MALFGTKKVLEVVEPGYIGQSTVEPSVQEELKGLIAQKQDWFGGSVGEAHPFDFAVAEGVYSKVGYVQGAVDKVVQSVWGPGVTVKSENEKAEKIIKQWIHDSNFQFHGRRWTKEGLAKGSAFLELGKKGGSIAEVKVLNANYMFVKRDDRGKIISFNQYFGLSNIGFQRTQLMNFKPEEIAFWTYNNIGDCVYGLGVIQPNMPKIDDLIGADKSMHKILKRKANSPLVATLGDKTKNIIPGQASIDGFGDKMRFMQETTEWCVSDLVRMSVIDFGNVGDKFTFPVEHDMSALFFGLQVPEVLMGRGNISEGLAKVQMSAYERWIASIQEDLSVVIEEKIFRVVLQANGLDAHVDIVWGLPSKEDVAARIATLNTIISNMSASPELHAAAEKELAKLLELKVEEPPEVEREEEEKKPVAQPPEESYEGRFSLFDEEE